MGLNKTIVCPECGSTLAEVKDFEAIEYSHSVGDGRRAGMVAFDKALMICRCKFKAIYSIAEGFNLTTQQ